MQHHQTLSKKRLEVSLNYLALVIDQYGEAFWPIFDRLEEELDVIVQRENKIKSRIAPFR